MPWYKKANPQVKIDTQAYEESIRKLIFALVDSTRARHQDLAHFQFDPNRVISGLQQAGYPDIPSVQQSLQSQDSEQINQRIMEILKWTNKVGVSDWRKTEPARTAWRYMRDYADHLDVQNGMDPEYSEEQAEKDVANLVQQTRQNMQAIANNVQSAIQRVPQWGGSPVTVRAREASKEDQYFEAPEDATVEVGGGGGWGGEASFTYFVMEGGRIEIDDVLEGGDQDFFVNQAAQGDYFNLIQEIRNPGSTNKGGKILTLYTARPMQDRQLYQNATSVPTGLFLTTNENSAEALGEDLGGPRDMWMVKIDSRYLVCTLDMPGEKHYQIVSPGQVPVKQMVLVTPYEMNHPQKPLQSPAQPPAAPQPPPEPPKQAHVKVAGFEFIFRRPGAPKTANWYQSYKNQ